MSPRVNVTEERKGQIITAAEDVFTKKGLDEARMDDIAEKTGLSKGTLYLYFKSKDDLIIAILDRLFQREFAAMNSALQLNIPAREKFNQFVDLATRDISAMLRLMPIAYEFLALAFRNKYVQRALHDYFNRFMDIIVPIVQQGIDSGEFRQVDAQEVALATGAIFEGTILLWVYDRSRVEPVRNIKTSMKLLLDGVLTQRDETTP